MSLDDNGSEFNESRAQYHKIFPDSNKKKYIERRKEQKERNAKEEV